MENELQPPRIPNQNDLLILCKELNTQQAKYIVVGGLAVIQLGFLRLTEDIDLLIEPSKDNQKRVCKALEILPDKAVRELGEDDLTEYLVVRVADEIVVDLMLSACGINYNQAVLEVETHTIENIPIPFASAKLLLKMKQTYREKDAIDRQFLEQKIKSQKKWEGRIQKSADRMGGAQRRQVAKVDGNSKPLDYKFLLYDKLHLL